MTADPVLLLVLVFFLAASLLLYVVMGGADYGAGILELLPSGKHTDNQRRLINNAMGPVWEANHIWLILVIVILFMGFPGAFRPIVISLHMPIVALLFGIVVRGAVFTFRHYDAVQEPRSQNIYTLCFGLSSIWTSLWLGIIAASLFRGKLTDNGGDFWTTYVAPWWGFYPLSVGVFTALIFSYLASIYLVGETKDVDMKKFFSRRALVFNILVVLWGACLFFIAHASNESLFEEFFSRPLAMASMAAATVSFAVLWLMSKRDHPYLTRLTAAAQTTFILFGWYAAHAPYVISTVNGPLRFTDVAAPAAVVEQLCLALAVGSAFIFPSLFFLLKVFKSEAR